MLEDAFVDNLELFKSKPDAALKYVSHGEYPARREVERQRARRVHQRDQPHPEPERSGDEGVAMDRRRFLGQAGLGIGMAALGGAAAARLVRSEPSSNPESRSRARQMASPVFRISRRRPSA